MTVGDLIERLKAYPLHTEVMAFNADYNETLPVDSLSFYDLNGCQIVELFATGGDQDDQ